MEGYNYDTTQYITCHYYSRIPLKEDTFSAPPLRPKPYVTPYPSRRVINPFLPQPSHPSVTKVWPRPDRVECGDC